MNYSRLERAVVQAFSWMAAGVFGGVTLSIFKSGQDVLSPGIIFLLLLIFVMAVYSAYWLIDPESTEESLSEDLENLQDQIESLNNESSEPEE